MTYYWCWCCCCSCGWWCPWAKAIPGAASLVITILIKELKSGWRRTIWPIYRTKGKYSSLVKKIRLLKNFRFDVLVFANTHKHRPARPQVKPIGLSINQFRTLATTAESGSWSVLYYCMYSHSVTCSTEDLQHTELKMRTCTFSAVACSISRWPKPSLDREDTSG